MTSDEVPRDPCREFAVIRFRLIPSSEGPDGYLRSPDRALQHPCQELTGLAVSIGLTLETP